MLGLDSERNGIDQPPELVLKHKLVHAVLSQPSIVHVDTGIQYRIRTGVVDIQGGDPCVTRHILVAPFDIDNQPIVQFKIRYVGVGNGRNFIGIGGRCPTLTLEVVHLHTTILSYPFGGCNAIVVGVTRRCLCFGFPGEFVDVILCIREMHRCTRAISRVTVIGTCIIAIVGTQLRLTVHLGIGATGTGVSEVIGRRTTKRRTAGRGMDTGCLGQIQQTTHVGRQGCEGVCRIQIVDDFQALDVLNDFNDVLNVSLCVVENTTHVR